MKVEPWAYPWINSSQEVLMLCHSFMAMKREKILARSFTGIIVEVS